MAHRAKKHSGLGFDTLEKRECPAGNITAVLSGSDLLVMGDALGNQASVSQSPDGTVQITGLAGTTVNGKPAEIFPLANLTKAEFKLDAGDDELEIVNLRVASDLIVEGGDGADVTRLFGTISGDKIEVKTGAGDDQVLGSDASVIGDLSVAGEDGVADVTLIRVLVDGNLDVTSKDADDQVGLFGVQVTGDANVETGKGNDIVTARNSTITRGFAVETDEGNDWVVTQNATIGADYTIETGTGNDRVDYQTRVTVNKSVHLNTGDGDDLVMAEGVSAAIDAIFVGGAGFDTFVDNGVTAGVKKEIKEFELIV